MVIPVHNKAPQLETTLKSVLDNHGNCPFECILVDDNSTDGSSKIAKRFEKEHPEVFTYVKIQHRGKYGPTYARNVGIRLTDSEYICFLDADDELLPGHLDRCVGFLNKFRNYDLYGEPNMLRRLDEDGNIQLCKFTYPMEYTTNLEDFITTFQPHFCSFVWRTEIVKENPFVECVCEDMVFMYNIMHRCSRLLFNCKAEPSFIYNSHLSDVCRKYDDIYNLKEEREYLGKYLEVLGKMNPDFPWRIVWDKENEHKWSCVKLKLV